MAGRRQIKNGQSSESEADGPLEEVTVVIRTSMDETFRHAIDCRLIDGLSGYSKYGRYSAHA